MLDDSNIVLTKPKAYIIPVNIIIIVGINKSHNTFCFAVNPSIKHQIPSPEPMNNDKSNMEANAFTGTRIGLDINI